MNDEWQTVKDNAGVCGTDAWVEPDPALTEVRNNYRWTPQCQRAFLEALAFGGSVMRAAKEVGKSPRSAYDLRFRRDGTAFRLGWDAAILVSRYALADMLMDRAVNGYEEVSSKQEDGTTMRGRFDNRLGMSLLGRLDRIAEAQAVRRSRDAQVQLVAQDFESFLDLIERGGKGSEAALFFEARDPTPQAQLSVMDELEFDCELDRISATEEAVPHILDEEPEVAAQRLSVWYDDDSECWKTNFPKPAGDEGQYVDETCRFGSRNYERTLSSAEEAAHLTALAHKHKPWIDAAAAARDAWFGVKMAA
ncbi:MAG: hypothetical protein ABI668_15205 [Sphingorhabdus sp.]